MLYSRKWIVVPLLCKGMSLMQKIYMMWSNRVWMDHDQYFEDTLWILYSVHTGNLWILYLTEWESKYFQWSIDSELLLFSDTFVEV
jgi:hypothetical protein